MQSLVRHTRTRCCVSMFMLAGESSRQKHGENGVMLIGKPDSAWEASRDLRSLGEALMRISRMLHEHARRLEIAVEGTYAGESSDPRVQLLSDSLRICRTSDLELGRVNQVAQRSLKTLQEQLDRSAQALPAAVPQRSQKSLASSFEQERDALNTSIINL